MRRDHVVFVGLTVEEERALSLALDRMETIAEESGVEFDRLHHAMSLRAAHLNGCPLDFDKLLGFDDFSFVHDMVGIDRHINRHTGQLGGCFLPRCAVNEPAGGL